MTQKEPHKYIRSYNDFTYNLGQGYERNLKEKHGHSL